MADVTHYYVRARDSGTGGWVYWNTTDATATPLSTDTTPNYTGALSNRQIINQYTVAVTETTTSSGLPVKLISSTWRDRFKFPTMQLLCNSSDVLVFSGSNVRVT